MWHVDTDKRTIEVKPRKRDDGHEWTRRFLKTYEMFEGEPIDEAMMRIYLQIASSILVESAERRVMLSPAADDEEFYEPDSYGGQIEALVFSNVIPVTVRPTFTAYLSMPCIQPRPQFLEKLVLEWNEKLRNVYAGGVCRCPGYAPLRTTLWENFALHEPDCKSLMKRRAEVGTPAYVAGNAFISGGTSQGVLEALSNIQHNIMRPRPRRGDMQGFTRDVIVVLTSMYRTVRGTAACKIPPPQFSHLSLTTHTFTDEKNAGYFNVHTGKRTAPDGTPYKLVNSCSQMQAYTYALSQVLNITERVRKTVRAGKNYNRDDFPTLAAKLAVKSEVRTVGSSSSKTRIFFIMNMIKLFIDKELFSEVVKKFYGMESCAIGHKWAKGGAHKLATALHAWDPEWEWFCTDIAKLDQRLHGWLLCLIFSTMIVFFSRDDPEAYEMMKHFLIFSVDDIVSTLIKWPGKGYRFIVGVMFSGLYVTSIGDTIAVILALRCAVREFSRTEGVLKRGDPQPVIYVYGDNVIMGWRRDLLRAFVLPKNPKDPITTGFLGKNMEEVWGMPLKADETAHYTSFFTKLRTVTDPRTGYNRVFVRYYGPVFLKRRFIQHEIGDLKWAMPFRPSRDYYDKCITTASPSEDPASWTARWAGLLLDTAGTNTEAHAFLMFMARRWLWEHRAYESAIHSPEYFNQVDDSFASMVEDAIFLHPTFWKTRTSKMGVTAGIAHFLLDANALMNLFRPEHVPKYDTPLNYKRRD